VKKAAKTKKVASDEEEVEEVGPVKKKGVKVPVKKADKKVTKKVDKQTDDDDDETQDSSTIGSFSLSLLPFIFYLFIFIYILFGCVCERVNVVNIAYSAFSTTTTTTTSSMDKKTTSKLPPKPLPALVYRIEKKGGSTTTNAAGSRPSKVVEWKEDMWSKVLDLGSFDFPVDIYDRIDDEHRLQGVIARMLTRLVESQGLLLDITCLPPGPGIKAKPDHYINDSKRNKVLAIIEDKPAWKWRPTHWITLPTPKGMSFYFF
jgi:hypothetical protein